MAVSLPTCRSTHVIATTFATATNPSSAYSGSALLAHGQVAKPASSKPSSSDDLVDGIGRVGKPVIGRSTSDEAGRDPPSLPAPIPILGRGGRVACSEDDTLGRYPPRGVSPGSSSIDVDWERFCYGASGPVGISHGGTTASVFGRQQSPAVLSGGSPDPFASGAWWPQKPYSLAVEAHDTCGSEVASKGMGGDSSDSHRMLASLMLHFALGSSADGGPRG